MKHLFFGLNATNSGWDNIGAYLNACVANAQWVLMGIILLAGITLAFCLYKRHTKANVFLSVMSVVCAVLLCVGYFLQCTELVAFTYALVVLFVILYQPELRSTLAKVAESRFPTSGKREAVTDDEYMEMIESVCEAATQLSSSKTGALMVLERRDNVDHIAKNRPYLDANVNSYLIGNIFYDKAPLHDGAILIRNCRIYAASCVLPLSPRSDIEQSLGTRHRAAIGMSETSDAIVIVVSEETGVISIAYGGELKRNFTFQSLHAFLTKHLR